jgi:molecular chaperone Hsp33
LQLVGDGPLRGVTADANANGDVRGYVARPEATPAEPTGRQLGGAIGRNGVLTVVRDLGLRELYEGRVALVSGEIDEDVESYLRASEQVPSALSCEVVLDGMGMIARAAGVLVQALPGGASDVVDLADRRFRDGALYALLEQGEIDARTIAETLSPSRPIEFLADRPVQFRCTCSAERIHVTLRMLTRRDLDEMIAEDKPAQVTCNFCNTTHRVGVDELAKIRDELPSSSSN